MAQPAAAQHFKAPDIEVNEGERAVFEFTLPHVYHFSIRYAWRTRDGSAKAGEDYRAAQGHVEFPAGTRSGRVEVQTHKDDDADDEDFALVLSDQQTQ